MSTTNGRRDLEVMLSFIGVLFAYFQIITEVPNREVAWVALLLAQLTINNVALLALSSLLTFTSLGNIIGSLAVLLQLVTFYIGLHVHLKKFIHLESFLVLLNIVSFISLLSYIVFTTIFISIRNRKLAIASSLTFLTLIIFFCLPLLYPYFQYLPYLLDYFRVLERTIFVLFLSLNLSR
jgi:hypothetical protein